ncbi:MAG: primosomal protein N' [Desulfobacterales bacterium]|nr:primosomal protein N' [Desulfobacterales bacterium]
MVHSNSYIDVAVALPVFGTFTYQVPDKLMDDVSVGKRVLVPFGRRRVTGYVLGPGKSCGRTEMKFIQEVLDRRPLFPAVLIPFFEWISSYYLHPIGEVIKGALPGGLNLYEYSVFKLTEKGERALQGEVSGDREGEVLSQLKTGSARLKDLNRMLQKNISEALMAEMEKKGWIDQKTELRGARTRPRMERFVSLQHPDVPLRNISDGRQKIIAALSSVEEVALKNLKAIVPNAAALIRSLQKGGYVRTRYKRVFRDPFGESILPDTAPTLTGEQLEVVTTISASLGREFSTYLLAGVTGSGKTEVYLQLAEAALTKGYAALVLVPEIVLISQMERSFRSRFGERIAVLHSGLSPGERYDQWNRILNGETPIVIGARSAIFAPLDKIGLIVVDEEHDTSYKQESGLRYNARDLAVVRAKEHGCIALLGSATPSIQSAYNADTKKFIELTLKDRVEKQPLPEIRIVDLGENRDERGVRRFITPELHDAMKVTLGRHEQVLLFLNRRGFAGLPVCSVCGEAVRCKNCDISMTLHQQANAYKCHYCGFSRAFSLTCDRCGSSKIKLLGLGTEKVEAAVRALFPEARVARMDRDTTARRGSIVTLLKGLRNRTIDVLVGTQMIAKGHDFPNITLVGVICADLSLSFPDFRAGERTFQLLAQVAGRAGRGKVPGRVVLQTYNPKHFSILAARDQDSKRFYAQEITFRKALNYPPFSRIIQVRIAGKHKDHAGQVARELGEACSALQQGSKSFCRNIEVLGPIRAPLARIAQEHRWQILIKGKRAGTLHQFVRQLIKDRGALFNQRKAKVLIDVDPFFMM